MMVEFKAITYEQARAEHFKGLMDKAQRRMKYWEARIDRTRPNNLMDEAYGKASDAGWEYNFYKDALEALDAQPKWISTEEKEPEIPCIVFFGDNVKLARGITHIKLNGKNLWFTDDLIPVFGMPKARVDLLVEENAITHWMPLPEPPKEEA